MGQIESNIKAIKEHIQRAAERAGRKAGDVKLVAVTKTVPVERIKEAVAAGLTTLGENRVQEAEAKIASLKDSGVEWHLIGHLQSNKAKEAVRLFNCIQSVDSLRLAQILEREAEKLGKKLPVLLEVNVGGEASKFGVKPEEAQALLEGARSFKFVSFQGLMTVVPQVSEPQQARPYFKTTKSLRDDLEKRLSIKLPILSMGMTEDFEVAVEEGATLVRVGRGVFGERS